MNTKFILYKEILQILMKYILFQWRLVIILVVHLLREKSSKASNLETKRCIMTQLSSDSIQI